MECKLCRRRRYNPTYSQSTPRTALGRQSWNWDTLMIMMMMVTMMMMIWWWWWWWWWWFDLMSEPVHEVGEVPPRHGASVPIAYMAANIILTIARVIPIDWVCFCKIVTLRVVRIFLGILSFYCFMISACLPLLACLVKSYHWLGNLLKTSLLVIIPIIISISGILWIKPSFSFRSFSAKSTFNQHVDFIRHSHLT